MITNEMIQKALDKVPGFQLIDKSYGRCENIGCVFTLLYVSEYSTIFNSWAQRAYNILDWARSRFGVDYTEYFQMGFDNRPYVGWSCEHHLAYSNGQEIRKQWKPICGVTHISVTS